MFNARIIWNEHFELYTNYLISFLDTAIILIFIIHDIKFLDLIELQLSRLLQISQFQVKEAGPLFYINGNINRLADYYIFFLDKANIGAVMPAESAFLLV